MPQEQRPALPSGGAKEDGSLRDRYGSTQTDWVYCWRCDMAISLDDLQDHSGYDPARGLFHLRCPRPGSAPLIPMAEALKRNEAFDKRHIAIGRNVTPSGWEG
jgi:hypothetical protein